MVSIRDREVRSKTSYDSSYIFRRYDEVPKTIFIMKSYRILTVPIKLPPTKRVYLTIQT